MEPVYEEKRRGDSRTTGWTISITGSSATDEEIQVQVQEHYPLRTEEVQREETQRQEEEIEPVPAMGVPRIEPRLPTTYLPPPIPTLATDRVVLSTEDLTAIRIKCSATLALGILIPPLWLLMGWSHILDTFLLPPTSDSQGRTHVITTYRPFRTLARVLSIFVVLGSFTGIVIGALAVAGVIN
jgi:hypothetical protein